VKNSKYSGFIYDFTGQTHYLVVFILFDHNEISLKMIGILAKIRCIVRDKELYLSICKMIYFFGGKYV